MSLPSPGSVSSPSSVQFVPGMAKRFPRVVTVHLRSSSPPPQCAPASCLLHPSSPGPTLSRSTLPAYPTLLRPGMRSVPLGKSPTATSKQEFASVDERVARFLVQRFGLREQQSIRARCGGAGEYEIHGRAVTVEWQHIGPSDEGRLIVVDGPLRQPLADYLEGAEANAEYEAIVVNTTQTAVHSIPTDRRISFHDDGKEYSRLDAMRVAKEQALVRERAANYMQAGRAVPDDIMATYAKTIEKKLKPVSASKLRERGKTLLRCPPH